MCATDPSGLIDKYFSELDDHIVSRIRDGKVGDSCFAAVMFMFAAVDSLGRLMAPSHIEGSVHSRFTYVLQNYFPPAYFDEEDRLWRLRNDLMHNALNVATFLAAISSVDASYQHLELVPNTDYLFLNTCTFQGDLCRAIDQVKGQLRQAETALEAASRLEEASIPGFREPPTPPAVVWFRQL